MEEKFCIGGKALDVITRALPSDVSCSMSRNSRGARSGLRASHDPRRRGRQADERSDDPLSKASTGPLTQGIKSQAEGPWQEHVRK